MTNHYIALRASVGICNEPGALVYAPATKLIEGAPVFVPLAPGAAFVPDGNDGGTDATLMRHLTDAEQMVIGADYRAASVAADERAETLSDYLGLVPTTVATDAALSLAMDYSWRTAGGGASVEDI